MTHPRAVLLFASILILPSSSSLAQVITGTILGSVRDSTGAVLPGATVTLASPALPSGPATVVTNEKGQYRYPNLAPGVYSLEVTLAGFGSYLQEGLRVQVGATLERRVVLSLTSFSETVLVSGESPLVDTQKSGLSTNYGNEYLQNTPVRRFSMFDLLKSAPGMAATGELNTTVSAFGSNTDENTYLMDGTDFTAPSFGGAWPWPDTDVIEEIEIVSLGASAEYGNLTGAVFNVVTKQGTNEFQFDASYYTMFDALTSDGSIFVDCECPLGETGYLRDYRRDFTVHAGGPIVKNKAWIYGGYQYLRDSFSQPGTDSRFPAKFDTDRIFWKFTWQINDRVKLMHSLHDDFWTLPGFPTVSRPFESTFNSSGHNPSLTFADITHILSESTFYDVRVSGFYSPGDDTVPNGNFGQSGRQDVATGIWSGSAPFSGGFRQARTAVHGKLSHYATDFLGADHDFKFGVQFVNGSHEGHYGYTNDAVYYDYYGQPYYGVFRERYDYGGQFKNLGAFAEDVVRVGERLTLQLGLRFDRIEAISQDIPRLDESLAAVGTVQGLGTLYTWNNVAPRLGLNLQLDGEGRTVLRANWGRFYRGAQTSEISSTHPGFTPITVAFFDPATNDYTDVAFVIDPIADLRIDPGTKAPRTDQFSIGLDRELGPDLAIQITYIKKDGERFPGWEVLNAEYGTDTVTLESGQILEVFPILTDPDDRVFNLTSREDFVLDYDGILLALQKRWSRNWQGLVSYTWSESRGLLGSNWRLPGGSQTSRVTGFTSAAGRDPNNFTNATGNLLNDRTHMFRIQGAVQLPRIDVLVGANFQYVTGKPYAADTRVRLPQGSQRIYIESLGSRRLSSQSLMDLRLSKIFRFGETGRFEILADILNLFNDQSEEQIVTRLFTSPNFAEGRRWLAPRRAMIGVKFVY